MPSFTELWTRVPVGVEASPQNSSVTGVLLAEGDTATGSTEASHGSRGLALSVLGPGAGASRISWDQAESGRYVLSLFLKLTKAVTQFEDIAGIRHAGGYMGILVIGNDGKLVLMNAASGGVSASRAPSAMPINEWVRIDIAVRKGTSTTNGYLGFSYWTNNGNTLAHQWESSAMNAGTADVAQVFIGRTTGRAEARTMHFGLVRGMTLASGWPAAYDLSTAPPVLTLGSETNLEPGHPVTLELWAADPAGGPVTTTLTQTGGTPVTISGGKYTAPPTFGGETLTFAATATKASGLRSTATAQHVVLPATEGFMRGALLTPGYLRKGVV